MRALLKTFLVGLLLVGISFFSGCAIVESLSTTTSTSTTTTTTVWPAISQIDLTTTSGAVSPDNASTTSINIWLDPFGYGYRIKLSRTGGANIVSGAASELLGNSDEMIRLARAITVADASAEVSERLYGGGTTTLELGEIGIFVQDSTHPAFSTNVQNLVDYLWTAVEESDLEQAPIPVFDSTRTPHAREASSVTAHSATLVTAQFGSGSWYEFGASYWKTSAPELKTEIVKNPPVYHEDRIGIDMLYYAIQNLEPDTEYAFQATYDYSTVRTFRTLAAE